MEALNNWREEKRSAYIYRALSRIETNPIHQTLFLELSGLAEKQAGIWEKQLTHVPKEYHPDLRARFVIKLVQCFGARSLRIALAAMKIRGMSIYHCPDLSHHSLPSSAEHTENRHGSLRQGNNIRAAVFGINDGLISNASLILGIAGAHVGNEFILISGVAGLLAGACSMSAGEYVSVRSQREMLEYQLELEKNELELYPEEEAAELALIYQARGLPKEEAEKVASILIQNPEKALATLAREELGINPDDLISPYGAAISSFFSFAVGAFIPLIPFIIRNSEFNLLVTIVLTSISLFTVGSILSLFTQRSVFWGGLRMLLIGTLAGSATYLIGMLVGLNRI
jgi:vacuolar iron transporter family protein